MALVDVSRFNYPRMFFQEVSGDSLLAGGTIASYTFNSDNIRMAWIGQAPRDMTVTDVNAYVMAFGTTSISVRIESMGSNGRPSGTLLSAGSEGTKSLVSGDHLTWKAITLSTPVAISMGQWFCIVFRRSTAVSTGVTGFTHAYAARPRAPTIVNSTDAGSTWATTQSFTICAYLSVSSGTPPEIEGLTSYVYNSMTSVTINGGTTPDECAAKFTASFACRIVGFKVAVGAVGVSADFTLVITDGAGNVVQTVACDAQAQYSNTSEGFRNISFTAPITVAAGDTYYFGIRADNTGANTSLSVATLDVASGGASACTSGADYVYAHRTWTAGTPGAWTTPANKTLVSVLLIDQISDVVDSTPTYFGGMEPVPYPGVELQPQILYKSIFDTPGAYILSATGWTNSGNGAITRLIDPFSNIVWEADANTSEGVVVFPHPVSANAIGVARHNLDGHTITIEYSDDDGVTWYPAGAFSPAAGRILFEPLTGIYTADTWRFTVTGPTPAEISHLSLGIAAAFERRMYAGVVPSMLDREPKVSVGGGSGGQHVGDRLIRERVRQKFDVNNLTGEWVRVIGKPLIEGARDHSVFAAWRRGKYPNDIVYGFTDGDMTTRHAGPANYMDFNADVEGIDSWN